MKNKLSNFITAIKAENIKKSGTGFYWTGVVLAFLSPLLFYIVAIVQSTDEVKTGIPYNHGRKHSTLCLFLFSIIHYHYR
jgi:hypothetical protein